MDFAEKIRVKARQLVDSGKKILDLHRNLARAIENESDQEERGELFERINDRYFAWNQQAKILVKGNLDDRASAEFEALHEEAKANLGNTREGYGEYNWMRMRNFAQGLASQIGIVRSIPGYSETKALSMRGLLARDLMEDELAAAHHLLENGYVREAGVITGLVLERHLKLLCDKRGVALGNKETIGQLNDKLRVHYPDDAEYRRVQFLNEIRISCAHDKKSDPDPSKVSQLVSGVQGFIATIT